MTGEPFRHGVTRTLQILFQGRHDALVFVRQQRGRQSALTGTTCTTDAMRVVLNGSGRQIVVDDVRNVRDIQPGVETTTTE